MPNVVYPKSSGWVSETIMLVQGEPWNADDPFVRAHPEHFIDSSGATIRGSGRAGAEYVEKATAAPGEKRTARRTSKAETGDSE